MIISFDYNKSKWRADLSQPIDISIPLKHGDQNPNCYWAKPPSFTTIKEGGFIGSVRDGGTVNYKEVHFTPHGNGTHTECYGHISADEDALVNQIKTINTLCELITLEPERQGDDRVVTFASFKNKWPGNTVGAVAIRTLPNDKSKLNRKYTGTNPPYLEAKLLAYLNELDIKHLLVDLPSVDKERDEGKLLAHKAFFGFSGQLRKEATITELVYIKNEIKDGCYYLSLTPQNIELDASPSRPLLYKIASI